MKWITILNKCVLVFVLVMISSCVMPESDTSFLSGSVFINEKTSDKIVFHKKDKFIITWTSCEKPWIKNHPYEFEYIIPKGDKVIHLVKMASGDSLYFPYKDCVLELSDTGEKILFKYKDGRTGEFKRIK